MIVQLHRNYNNNMPLIMSDLNFANLAEILHVRVKARKMGTDIQDQQMCLTNDSGFRAISKYDETPGKQTPVKL